MDSHTRLTVRPEQMSCRVEGEVMILNNANGTFYSTQKVGMRIWEMLQSGATFGDLCKSITDEFEVTPDIAARDISIFVAELDRNQLIQIG